MQTLTVRETDIHLQRVLKQAQATHQPVLLVSEETAAPMAVVMEPTYYAAAAARPDVILVKRLGQLGELLTLLDSQWTEVIIRQAFPAAWRWHLEGVWEASQHRELPFRQLVVLLQMAAQKLDIAHFTREQVATWRACLHTLQQRHVSDNDLIDCDEALLAQGFPILLEFDDEMAASY